jgi:carbon-monoxide dehydrogenase medium subunit
MHDFELHQPGTLADALALLDEHGFDARPLAGGTALVLLMRQSLALPEHLVNLAGIEDLRGIRLEEDGLHIGALTSFRELESSPVARNFAPLLTEVYSQVATIRIRTAATVGGGLAHADPAQDPPAALLALDARVEVASTAGTRTLPVEELFVDYYDSALEPGELVTEVVVPPPPAGARGTYLKFLPRTEDDYATVAAAALGRIEDGACRDVRVALIAAGPTPLRAHAVEDALEGQPATVSSIRRAAEAVAEEVDPLDDGRGSAEYKRDMAVVYTRRALERTFGLAAS